MGLQSFHDVVESLQKKLELAITVSPSQEKLEKVLDLIRKETVKHETAIIGMSVESVAKETGARVEEVEIRKNSCLKNLTAIHMKIKTAIDAGVQMPEAAQGA